MMMVEMIMTGPVPPSTFPRCKTQKLGFKMLLEMMKNTQAGDSGGLELPDVCPLFLNRNQRSIVSLVLHTLYNFVENRQ